MEGGLPPADREERLRLEHVIQTAHTLDLHEAQALLAIRRKRLYRDQYPTFGQYLCGRWAMGRAHGNRLCKWAEVVENLSPSGDTYPHRERHARPLYDLSPEQQRLAWRRCLIDSKGKVSEQAVRDACEAVAASAYVGRPSPVPANDSRTPPPPHTPLRSPLAWYGSKHRLARDLIDMMPPHRCYVEAFGGSGALLFAKRPSDVEVYNDLNADVVHFFETLRGPLGKRLIRQLELTPHAREEHQECRRRFEIVSDPVERARCFFVLVRQSYSGIFGEAYSASKKKTMAGTFARRVDGLPQVIRRLRHVQIEQLDFRKLIRKYDGEDTFFYCDPPYVHSTRTAHSPGRAAKKYRHEMSDRDHEELLKLLLATKAKVMVSGYGCDLYDQKLRHWHRREKAVQCCSATTNNNPSVWRREVIWTNYEPPRGQEQALPQRRRSVWESATSPTTSVPVVRRQVAAAQIN